MRPHTGTRNGTNFEVLRAGCARIPQYMPASPASPILIRSGSKSQGFSLEQTQRFRRWAQVEDKMQINLYTRAVLGRVLSRVGCPIKLTFAYNMQGFISVRLRLLVLLQGIFTCNPDTAQSPEGYTWEDSTELL